jgi:hypothetical protein
MLRPTSPRPDGLRRCRRGLRGRSITVNAVAPGPTATDLFLKGKSQELIDRFAKIPLLERLGRPEDIANTIAFLASSDGGDQRPGPARQRRPRLILSRYSRHRASPRRRRGLAAGPRTRSKAAPTGPAVSRSAAAQPEPHDVSKGSRTVMVSTRWARLLYPRIAAEIAALPRFSALCHVLPRACAATCPTAGEEP